MPFVSTLLHCWLNISHATQYGQSLGRPLESSITSIIQSSCNQRPQVHHHLLRNHRSTHNTVFRCHNQLRFHQNTPVFTLLSCVSLDMMLILAQPWVIGHAVLLLCFFLISLCLGYVSHLCYLACFFFSLFLLSF